MVLLSQGRYLAFGLTLAACILSSDLGVQAEETTIGGRTVVPDDVAGVEGEAGVEGTVKWDDPRREKAVADFARRLGRLKPLGKNRRKDPEDFFLVATADVTAATKHADVRFSVIQGQRQTAETLVDYIAGAAEDVLRKWHVFARFKDESAANEALAMARMQYDQAIAYRQRLQKIYAVRSTRRC